MFYGVYGQMSEIVELTNGFLKYIPPLLETARE